jgi:protein involved in polysaccharide export with SLBB domain
MPLSRMVRPFLTCVAVFAICGCATRTPVALKPMVKVSPVPVWRIEVGDVIRTKVYREPDLSGDAAVTESGSAFLAGLGRLRVVGMSLDSLQADVQARYSKLIIDPAVDVQFTRDILIYGQVRTLGSFAVDQSTTVLGLLAKAGGSLGGGRQPLLYLVKRDGQLFTLPRDARLSSIDITRGDAVYVQDEQFFLRNQSTVTAIWSIAQVITAVAGTILIVTR